MENHLKFGDMKHVYIQIHASFIEDLTCVENSSKFWDKMDVEDNKISA